MTGAKKKFDKFKIDIVSQENESFKHQGIFRLKFQGNNSHL